MDSQRIHLGHTGPISPFAGRSCQRIRRGDRCGAAGRRRAGSGVVATGKRRARSPCERRPPGFRRVRAIRALGASGHDLIGRDLEFTVDGMDGGLIAGPTGDAHEDMDLLTVVMHEIGHVLGYDDIDDTDSDRLMSATLDSGERALPENDDLDGQSTTGDHDHG